MDSDNMAPSQINEQQQYQEGGDGSLESNQFESGRGGLLEHWPSLSKKALLDDETSKDSDNSAPIDDSNEKWEKPEPANSDEITNRWRLKIRLLSVVDLPISLLPPPHYESVGDFSDHLAVGESGSSSGGGSQSSVSQNTPLCPIFKFGLMKDESVPKDLTPNEKRANEAFTIEVSNGIRNSSGSSASQSHSKVRRTTSKGSHFKQTMTQLGDAFREGYLDHRIGKKTLESSQSLQSKIDSLAAGIKNVTSTLYSGEDATSSVLDYVDEDEGLLQDLSVFGGITNIPNISDIRCSVGKKIVGKAENGAAEWHEEIVWDNVSLMQTKLVIELCSRTPPHIYRGGGYREAMIRRGVSGSSNQSESYSKSVASESSGGNGEFSNDEIVFKEKRGKRRSWDNMKKYISIRAKQKTDFEKEMEEAHSAARVAQYLVERKSLQEDAIYKQVESSVDETEINDNKSGKHSNVLDLRLGYYSIPLRKLLLAWNGKEESLSVEKWFNIQECIPVGNGSEENVISASRGPSVLIQLSINALSVGELKANEERFDKRGKSQPEDFDPSYNDDSKSSQQEPNRTRTSSLGFGSMVLKGVPKSNNSTQKHDLPEEYLAPGKH